MSTGHKLPRFLNLRPYQGSTMDLVIGIDVGTTFSGVSYAILKPNIIPEVQPVPRFTGQTTSDAKIPSIMYFDKDLNLKAAGASAVSDTTINVAECEGWIKVEHFKMHLRPSNMRINTNGLSLGTLPPKMTPVEAMGHFLRYLYKETINYIEKYEPHGSELIKSFEERISFVLSHPNGWEGLQQQRMRSAAVFGGLVPNGITGHARLKFVTEGEASALACLANGLCPPNLQPGYRFVIADAGGGTLDVTTYEITQTSPLQLRELTSSDCRFAGGVFVNKEMYRLLKERLRGSHYDNPDELDDIVDKKFEQSLKREFSINDKEGTLWMNIGSRSENNSKMGIKKGYLRIEGLELQKCFQFSVLNLVESVKSQIRACQVKTIPVWLVGGFAASPWILEKVSEILGEQSIPVSRPDTNLAKAVANGNVLYALDNTVKRRVTRAAYGIKCSVLYDAFDPDHVRRKHLCFEDLEGDIVLPSRFSIILQKGVDVQDSEKHAVPYTWLASNASETMHKCTLIRYNGPDHTPTWYDENKADFSRLFQLERMHTYKNRRFWHINFSIEISFGQVELQARIKWIEDGVVHHGPATIFYEDE
ncbi:uncharacterized protein FOMMEDRAFT_159802 [Fomitiporia mediterranea MF3/22]|uniref:uncharacterized protein n=1 Tax=Fomitiporia mediterranea (strain MF3/22) TaxID=694068 RepID=UPI0004408931|nr:uncharacterized protein FOMMEDRAFT_159802 [Fomitiporia mediterranea MF3/22]EJD00154.1 hypothetical protein FOMMEDRAFT_159802 [Fomitiporia mediterranea MF3/22]